MKKPDDDAWQEGMSILHAVAESVNDDGYMSREGVGKAENLAARAKKLFAEVRWGLKPGEAEIGALKDILPETPMGFVNWANGQQEMRIPKPMPSLLCHPWVFESCGSYWSVKFFDCVVWDSEDSEAETSQEALVEAEEIAQNAAAWLRSDLKVTERAVFWQPVPAETEVHKVPLPDAIGQSWIIPIRCVEFLAAEQVTREGKPGTLVTRVYTEEGERYMTLPGHDLPRELVARAVLEVVRGEDRAREEFDRQADNHPPEGWSGTGSVRSERVMARTKTIDSRIIEIIDEIRQRRPLLEPRRAAQGNV